VCNAQGIVRAFQTFVNTISCEVMDGFSSNLWAYIIDATMRFGTDNASRRQGRSDGGGYRDLYPPQSAKVNFLWGKNDVRTAIQQFYPPPKTFIPPKTNFWIAPARRTDGRT